MFHVKLLQILVLDMLFLDRLFGLLLRVFYVFSVFSKVF